MTDVLAERHSKLEANHEPTLDPGARWLTMQDLADRYQVALQTIRAWHSQGKTPRGLKLNNKFVRFRLDEVQEWEREQIGEK